MRPFARLALLVGLLGAPPREHVTILVREGRIAAIGEDVGAAGVPVLDAAGATVLPGLIEVGDHDGVGHDAREPRPTRPDGSEGYAAGARRGRKSTGR
jgi:imidazolonepropionase-like amidohydrolase